MIRPRSIKDAIQKSAKPAARYDSGMISRGKYIFVSRLGCSTSPCTALEIEAEKKIQGRSPENTNTGYCVPPVAMVENRVKIHGKMHSKAKGCRIAHNKPRKD